MFLWGWGGDPDPNFILSIFTTAQINSWSDCAWSDPQYDKLFLEQQTTVDPAKRADIVHQMEQIIYQQSPYVVLVYPADPAGLRYAALAGLGPPAGRHRHGQQLLDLSRGGAPRGALRTLDVAWTTGMIVAAAVARLGPSLVGPRAGGAAGARRDPLGGMGGAGSRSNQKRSQATRESGRRPAPSEPRSRA